MGFHLCPVDPRVQKLFRSKPELLCKKRIAIQERATRARENLSIPKEAVLQALRSSDFSLATNQFHCLGATTNINNNVLAACLLHIGSQFKGAHIYFWEDKESKRPQLNLLVTESAIPGIKKTDKIKHLIKLEFSFDNKNNLLVLDWVDAPIKNIAGNVLAALYNFAKDTGFSAIGYYGAAKQFYFHIDFGKPLSRKSWGYMRLPVI